MRRLTDLHKIEFNRHCNEKCGYALRNYGQSSYFGECGLYFEKFSWT